MGDPRVWLVTSTVPTRADAVDLARAVVRERLAASAEVNGPTVSIFWHLGELGEGEEWRVVARTGTATRDALTARLAEMHPWENPEISAMPLAWCPDAYAEWVERATGSQGSGD
ncbi:MAG: divalent-cation tolerance protein CutA [Actinobacteria bacterium]|nr:divalent-cation tolerance protein CutA [Actinomycetota bacterium]